MEESLQNTLVLAQRTADETKASAHKEADLIREKARLEAEREIANYNDAIGDVRREHQRTVEASEKVRTEFRNLLATHLALLEKGVLPALPPEAVLPPPSTASGNGEAPPSDDTTRITVY
jgi:hypothetical protein